MDQKEESTSRWNTSFKAQETFRVARREGKDAPSVQNKG